MDLLQLLRQTTWYVLNRRHSHVSRVLPELIESTSKGKEGSLAICSTSSHPTVWPGVMNRSDAKAPCPLCIHAQKISRNSVVDSDGERSAPHVFKVDGVMEIVDFGPIDLQVRSSRNDLLRGSNQNNKISRCASHKQRRPRRRKLSSHTKHPR
jgi:hypothetical protein